MSVLCPGDVSDGGAEVNTQTSQAFKSFIHQIFSGSRISNMSLPQFFRFFSKHFGF